jgi:predicted alpha-1,2-mannosidase
MKIFKFSAKTILIFSLFTFLSLQFPVRSLDRLDLVEFVDPFIGTEGGGHTFPGATLPFGMVKLGPDCGDLSSNSGYQPDGNIYGFSHVHISGTGGGPKYGNMLMVPITGDINLNDYSSSREDESANAGYYTVKLTRYDVKAELTVTHSVGFHRYTFPETDDAHILIDAGSFLGEQHGYGEAQELVGSELEIVSDTQIEGYTRVRGGWNEGDAYTVYFCAVFDTPASSYGTWKEGKISSNTKLASDTGCKTGAYFTYKTGENQVIRVKVGISFLGRGKARENILSEIPNWNFNEISSAARERWNILLNSAIVEGGTERSKTIFYTALYHTMLMPTNRTGETPKWTSKSPYYDDYYAIWDTFRSLHPLLTLLLPSKQIEMVNSLIDIYRYEGYMPDARSGNDNGRTQGGSNCDILLADAFVKGLEGIDYKEGLWAMVKNAEIPPGGNQRKQGRGGITDYNKIGYVSTDYERAGTRTVEYAYCDFAIAQLAKGLGKDSLYRKYINRAENWKNLWRPIEHKGARGFIWPRRRNGSWVEDFNTLRSGSWSDFFYESHSWEYSLYMPQDVGELIEECGGEKAFIQRLDTFFIKDYYNVSNEPGFLTPCLYIWTGRQDKTSERVRKIIRNHYDNTRAGIPGNDDSGSMSSWVAFHLMGFYPNAGQDVYLITAPHFEKTTIHLKDGKTFVIEAKNLSDENIYVKSARLNGKPLNRAWFRHTEIKNGGTLELEMSDEPSGWGKRNPPPSMSD